MAIRSARPLRAVRKSADDARLARYAADGDPRDLEALVLRYRPLAVGLARRYAGRLHSMDDLTQVACLGLIKALQRFDPARGTTFTTFAVPTILGELRRFCRDTGWSLHVSRGLQERILAVRRAGDAATASLGRTATVAETAEALGWDCEAVVDALLAGASRSTVPLEADPGESADPGPLVERLGDVDPGFELVESLTALEGSLGALTRAEQRVLRLRFEEDLTLTEIAARLDLPDNRVARLLASALRTLRLELGVPEDDDDSRAMAVDAPRRQRGLELVGGPVESL